MKVFGAIMVILALVTAALPQFTDCQSQGRALTLQNGKTVPMKCHWTAEAEMALGGTLLALGGLVYFNKRRETLRSLAILGGVLGVFVILVPANLIGVCSGNEMLCNILMKPTLLLSGILTIVVNGAIFAASTRGAAQALGGGAGQPA